MSTISDRVSFPFGGRVIRYIGIQYHGIPAKPSDVMQCYLEVPRGKALSHFSLKCQCHALTQVQHGDTLVITTATTVTTTEHYITPKTNRSTIQKIQQIQSQNCYIITTIIHTLT